MPRMRVLIVTDRADAPYRYRCVHAAAQLCSSGALCHVARADQAGLAGSVGAYSVVVLFRLPWSPDVDALVDAARRAGVALVFDCDDLVFDPAAAVLMPFRAGQSVAEWQLGDGAQLAALRRTFEACNLFIGSTPALAEWAAQLGKPARVHPNVLPDASLKLEPWLRRARTRLLSEPTIGYFSGSNTHDLDFESVAPSLRVVLERMPGARLLVGGHVDVRTAFRGLEQRVVRLPHVSFRVLPWALAACHVTLAPISAINAFTDGKSALKFFEPGIFGVPVVASPIAEMRRAIEHGVTGWLAADASSWVTALEAALDPATSRAVGEAAALAVRREHTSSAVAGRLAALLGEVAVAASGREPVSRSLEAEEYDGRGGVLARASASVRRARDLAVVVAALREPVDAGPGLAAADAYAARLLAAAPGDGPVCVVGSPDVSGWHAVSQIEQGPALLGEARLTGTDPNYASPPIEPGARALRYAIVRMRATTPDGRGKAQLFWLSGRRGSFSERSSVDFSVLANGADITYVVDLWKSRDAGFWRGRPRRLRLRFDPLDRPGTARVLLVACVPDGWRFDGEAPAPAALALGRPRDARRRLARCLGTLDVGDACWVAVERDVAWTRIWLAQQLVESGVVVERLEATDRGTQVLLRRVGAVGRPGVDIVVPVFNAREQTLACVQSVVRHARGDYRLVIIDDASTDPVVRPALEAFAAKHDRVVLLHNERNLGFVRTCNRAMVHAAARDVLLLNSDTKVFSGFLQRLAACVYADSDTGIACPLSNNATICSAPDFCRPNSLPAGSSRKQMAALVRIASRRRRPELVTPVGFCMYVRAELLAKVGRFDAERFGRGFGEENDFGERAKAAGWKIRLADDVYVWHEGKASFGAAGFELSATNAPVLEARHPGYHAAVAHFIQSNPLAPIHEELRWHLERRRHAQKPAVMMLLHASPFREPCGGTEYVVRDLVQRLGLPRAVVAYPGNSSIEVAEVIDGAWDRASFHRFPLSQPVSRFCHDHDEANRELSRIIELFRVGHVHVHHLMGWPLSSQRVLARTRRPYSITVHDFYCVCPSQNLLDPAKNQRCCPLSIGDVAQTTSCMRSLFAQLALPAPDDAASFVDEHRAGFQRWLGGASRVVFPSPSTRAIVGAVHRLDPERALVLPHAYVPAERGGRATASPGAKLRVALIGEISYASKGADGYIDVMRRLKSEPVEWHLFGETDRFDFEQRLAALGPGVSVVRHGAYARDSIVGLLSQAAVDVGLMLPIWPETFSLTLSELVAAKVPVVAAMQGALADRLRGAAYAVLVDSPEQAAAALRDLCRNPARLQPLCDAAAQATSPDVHAWLSAHRELYKRVSSRAGSGRLRKGEYEALASSRVQPAATRAVTSTTQPAARHRSSLWYRRAEKLKPFLPESIRALARQRLSDRRLRPVKRFRLPGRHAEIGAGARLDARYLMTARLTSLDDDPHFLLRIAPLAAEQVGAIRFNVWCSNHGHTFAQLYWRHDGDAGFCEDKSLVVALDGRLGDWQEYVVRLDRKTHPTWYAGKTIVGLRFDPVNYAGLFCVGQLALCAGEPAPARRLLPVFSTKG